MPSRKHFVYYLASLKEVFRLLARSGFYLSTNQSVIKHLPFGIHLAF